MNLLSSFLQPQNPKKFVELEPDTAATLLDQANSGMSLVLITNSELKYTETVMSYAFDRFLPHGMVWQDLFDMVIVQVATPPRPLPLPLLPLDLLHKMLAFASGEKAWVLYQLQRRQGDAGRQYV